MSNDNNMASAVRYFGADAPAEVLAAKARCYAWAPFAAHTDEERAAHARDVEICEAYETTIVPLEPGPGEDGDE